MKAAHQLPVPQSVSTGGSPSPAGRGASSLVGTLSSGASVASSPVNTMIDSIVVQLYAVRVLCAAV